METKHCWPKQCRSTVNQLLLLKKLYPAAKVHATDQLLTWSGTLQPTPLSANYKVEIKYHSGARPVVRILEPKLQRRDGERIPHIYSEKDLCLYYPGEWCGQDQIAETIVPWTSEWLFHYEIWLATGVWCGGGEHPKVKKDPKKFQPSASEKSSEN